MKIIYVASPYAGDIEKNTVFAKRACRHVMEQGHAFFAPHLLYPSLLCESVARERQLALDMGLVMLSACDELWCYGDCISQGMMAEITEAERLGIPIRRIMEQKNDFVIGKVKGNTQPEAPTPVMAIGIV